MASTEHNEIETTVLIIGAGPVGLGLAAELGWRNVPCVVVERGDGTVAVPRTNAVNVRTMEFCRRWGIAETVRQRGTPADFPHTFKYVTSLGGYELGSIERPTHGGNQPSPTSPERAQRCNQLWFDPILADLAAGFPSVSIRFRTQYESYTEVDGGITAELQDRTTGRAVRARARYLVACCGGRSSIRESVGAQFEGDGAFGYPVDIYFRVDELWSYHDKGKMAMCYLVGPEGVWSNLEALDGRTSWRLTIHGSDKYIDPDTIDAHALLDRALGTDVPYEILAITPWVRRSIVATQYRYGNVFLAGDCAHQNPPDGGFGMNTGMGDAVDLGWKLSAVQEGWGGEALMDSYDAERRPVGRRNVAEAMKRIERRSFSIPTTVCDDSPDGEASRAEVRAQIKAMGGLFGADGVAIGYRYEPSPICVADERPEAPEDPANYVPTTAPGARAPHAWLSDGRSTLDLFGRGFVLLRCGTDAPEPTQIVEAAEWRHVPLEIVTLDDPEVLTLYQHLLILVRPDGHVAWRSNKMPENALSVIDRVRGSSDLS